MATMPEIHFRLVAVSSDGREIHYQGVPIENLAQTESVHFFRFKKDATVSKESLDSLIHDIESAIPGQRFVLLPWYIDLIKLVPVR